MKHALHLRSWSSVQVRCVNNITFSVWCDIILLIYINFILLQGADPVLSNKFQWVIRHNYFGCHWSMKSPWKGTLFSEAWILAPWSAENFKVRPTYTVLNLPKVYVIPFPNSSVKDFHFKILKSRPMFRIFVKCMCQIQHISIAAITEQENSENQNYWLLHGCPVSM